MMHREQKTKKRLTLFLAAIALSLMCATFFNTRQAFAGLTYTLSGTANTDVFNWPLGDVGETDVILISENMGLAKATKTYGTASDYTVVSMSGDYAIPDTDVSESGSSCQSIKYRRTIYSGDDYYPSNITLKFPKAAKKITGQEYDVVMTISDIWIKSYAYRGYGIPIVWGCERSFKFGALPYKADHSYSGSHGVKYKITIKLYTAGAAIKDSNLIDTGHSMLWGFDDIDVGDELYGGNYSSSSPWAEHVEINSGNYIEPFYVSNSTHLTVSKNSSNKITIYNEYPIGETGKEDVLYRVNPRGFSYIWQGSECGTTAAAIAGIIYKGESWVDTGTSFTHNGANGWPNGSTITVKGSSQKVVFWHRISRNSNGPDGDEESYYVEVQTSNGSAAYANTLARQNGNSGANCTSSSHCKYTSYKNTKKEVYLPGSPTGIPLTVSLTPGQTKHVWQRLFYQVSNVNSALGALATPYGGRCEWADSYKGSTVCIHLHRPPAKFTAAVFAEVKTTNANTYADYGNSSVVVTQDNGNYTIRFNGYIKRGTDEAGDTARTIYHYDMTRNTYNGTAISGKRTPASSDNTTNYLGTSSSNNTQFVIAKDSNYTYTGRLRYGESVTICATIYYDSVRDATNGHTSTNAHKCVTVYREEKDCKLSGANEYGIHYGENLGKIGVANRTLNANNAPYSFTSSSPSSFTSANNWTVSTSIFARPGDSIRFYYHGCAGGTYAAHTNSGINAANYPTTYKATGSLSSSTSEGYLFGDTVPLRKSGSSLKYTKERSWTDTDDRGNNAWLHDEEAEVELASPSANSSVPGETVPNTYSEDIYNTRSYSCTNLNGREEETGKSYKALDFHYQIAGRETAAADCNSYSKTAVASDVGHTITQSLSWNHLKVAKKSTGGSEVKDNNTFTAKANVVVPYNYVIEPALSAETEKNVLYLGSTATFRADLYVQPRKNTAFGEDARDNTYATITKKTDITLKYYVKRNGTTIDSGKTVKTSSKVRLNQTGAFYGNYNVDGSTEDGGHHYHSFDVYIKDGDSGSYQPGDKVCAVITVSPADSHDARTSASVYGADGPNNTKPGLSENGASGNSVSKTTCYTIAKKPTMSVEASSAYAGSSKGFITSKYTKQFGSNTSTEFIFGSWSEYGVFGTVRTSLGHGFASGATFGYKTQNSGIATNATRANSESDEIAKNDDAHGSVCAYSTQTLVNSTCSDNGTIGMAGMGVESVADFRDRLYTRFASNSVGNDPGDATCTDWSQKIDGTYKCVKNVGADSGRKYANVRAYLNADTNWDANGINHIHVKGPAYLGAGNTFLSVWATHNFGNNQEYDAGNGITFADRNYTRVIQIDGKLVLDANVRIGRYINESSSDDDPTLHNSGEIVQTIIIADEVEITSRVKQIDAIILANRIDTCAYDINISRGTNTFKSGKKLVIGTASGSKETTLNLDDCNNQLLFRAPVVAKRIELKRTYGAENGSGSIKRAEIFELNPYTYLWSYGQMGRYSQAVTTYSRELAPRY